jgi:hypothetical protein
MSLDLQMGKLNKKFSNLNPWTLILFVFPIPLVVLGLLFYFLSSARSDYKRVTSQFIQRQNQVLAFDAMELAREVSNLLEGAARDIQTLSLITPTASHFTQFYLSRVGQITQLDSRDDSINIVPLPLYNEIIYFNLRGDEQLRLKNGKIETRLRRFSDCSTFNLCDPALIRKALSLTEGELYFGKLNRWYSKENQIEKNEGAYLPIVYRGTDGVFLIGIDYRYFKELLSQPTFPYQRKNNLINSYQNGNYIYIVDSDLDFIAHPKFWNVMGIDPSTGMRVEPMETDLDEGNRPINIQKYKGQKLKSYFDRLLKRSFVQKSVDVFQASNLGGSNRVLSVAPVLLQKGQFLKTGVFGYVVLGCSVDYFEEPKEQYVPYY